MTAQVTTQGGQHTLHMERHFPQSVQRLWRAVSTADQLSAWWPMRIRDVPLQQGAPLRFFTEEGMSATGVLTDVVPERLLSLQDEGGFHTFRIELAPDGPGCHLTFTHTFPADQPPADHATDWHLAFEALAAVAADQPAARPPYDEALHAHYEQLLGEG